MKANVPKGCIPIVASTDDNYAYPLGVMFVSLLENTPQPQRFKLFVIDGGISEKKKQQLSADVTSRGSQLTFLDLDSEAYADFPLHAHLSKPAYYRISIPELFSDNVNRAIYLDCDLIIKDDLQKLWDFDLEDYAIGAVENISKNTHKTSKISQQDYFNSGVLLLDLNKWRNQGISEKVRHLLSNQTTQYRNDQCALNGAAQGKWRRLPLRWNHQSGLYRKSTQTQRYQLQGEYFEALWRPAILHYVGWSKPWLTPCFHPLASEYERYNNMALFSADNPIVPIDISKTDQDSLLTLLKKRLRQWLWRRRYRTNGYNLYGR